MLANEFCQNSVDPICLICALFGSPFRQSPLWFSPAEYDVTYRYLLKKAELVERDRNTRAQASINRWTRRAQTHHLFSTEVVSPNENFLGQIEFTDPIFPIFKNENPLVWLTAALLFTRRIGGGRRRGRGRCEFKLMQATDDNANLVAQQALTNWLGGNHDRS
jgi:CRISPR/Cas system CSM-associated protein Csm3 (group 7 of RAMP superfamily)